MDRFWAKVDATGDCWDWTAGTQSQGYGQFRETQPRRMLLAHRVAYEMLVGPIPEGLVLDHLCQRVQCVNPDHLEAVTQGENVRRSQTRHFCKRGHRLHAGNRALRGKCRKCIKINNDRARRSR